MESNSLPNWAFQYQAGPYGEASLIPSFTAAASSGFPLRMLPPPPAADSQIHFQNMTMHP